MERSMLNQNRRITSKLEKRPLQVGLFFFFELFLRHKHDRIKLDGCLTHDRKEDGSMTLEKTVYMNKLLSFYQDLLTEKQQAIMRDYYEEDYSLAEISQNQGISRQGVHDHVRRSEQALLELESVLHLAQKSDQRLANYRQLESIIDRPTEASHLLKQLIQEEMNL